MTSATTGQHYAMRSAASRAGCEESSNNQRRSLAFWPAENASASPLASPFTRSAVRTRSPATLFAAVHRFMSTRSPLTLRLWQVPVGACVSRPRPRRRQRPWSPIRARHKRNSKRGFKLRDKAGVHLIMQSWVCRAFPGILTTSREHTSMVVTCGGSSASWTSQLRSSLRSGEFHSAPVIQQPGRRSLRIQRRAQAVGNIDST